MLSESAWDSRGVRSQLITDANAHFGHACALVIDESAFAKKGEMSAGVARQWNGRLGKTDNSQVGVFAAVTREVLPLSMATCIFRKSSLPILSVARKRAFPMDRNSVLRARWR